MVLLNWLQQTTAPAETQYTSQWQNEHTATANMKSSDLSSSQLTQYANHVKAMNHTDQYQQRRTQQNRQTPDLQAMSSDSHTQSVSPSIASTVSTASVSPMTHPNRKLQLTKPQRASYQHSSDALEYSPAATTASHLSEQGSPHSTHSGSDLSTFTPSPPEETEQRMQLEHNERLQRQEQEKLAARQMQLLQMAAAQQHHQQQQQQQQATQSAEHSSDQQLREQRPARPSPIRQPNQQENQSAANARPAQEQPQQPSQQQQPAPVIYNEQGEPQDLSQVLASNDVNSFPGLARNGRYRIIDNLQLSLFGAVKLAYDYQLQEEVAIKISARNLATDGRARSGVKVLENVKREANVMRYMGCYRALHTVSNSRTMNDAEVMTCVCMKDCTCPPGVGARSNSARSRGDGPLEDACDFVCNITDEIEDPTFHYLATEYVSGGDLHSLLLSMPHHRLSEPQAKYLFRQLCLGVSFLHDHHIAHLDLSLENVCLSAAGRVKVIDFGVAVIHPLAPKPSKRSQQIMHSLSQNKQSQMSHSTANRHNLDPVTIQRRLSNGSDLSPSHSPTDLNPTATPSQRTRSLSSRARVTHHATAGTRHSPASDMLNDLAGRQHQPHQHRPSSNAALNNCFLHSTHSTLPPTTGVLSTFLCSPISDPRMQPGKVGYMSAELYGGKDLWNAYSNDCFSLGVILYCMLTGRPPFISPSLTDPWYKAIASSQWLQMFQQQQQKYGIESCRPPSNDPSECNSFVQVFSHLSPQALDFLDRILKPQEQRISLKDMLNHPWLADTNKRTRTSTKVSQVDTDAIMSDSPPVQRVQ